MTDEMASSSWNANTKFRGTGNSFKFAVQSRAVLTWMAYGCAEKADKQFNPYAQNSRSNACLFQTSIHLRDVNAAEVLWPGCG